MSHMPQIPPQVVLFGSIYGGWRQETVIPVLEALGVTYYDPAAPGGWTEQYGDREAEVMAACETIVMVINCETAAFTSLAETGWAALGAMQRGQHFILYVEEGCEDKLPRVLQDPQTESLQMIREWMVHWVKSSRYLVNKHAKMFDIEKMHLVDNLQAVVDCIKDIYAGRSNANHKKTL